MKESLPYQARRTQRERVAVVTGSASGIGHATVHELMDTEVPAFRVIGVDLAECPADLEDVAGLEWIQGDVASQSTWDRVVDVCREHDPAGAHCLVSCAADVVVAPFLETDIDDWRRLFEINVLGAVRGMQRLIPAMIERGAGAVAVVCSVNSFVVEDQVSAYSTSKAALLHVVRSAALEYASTGLRINAVCPGVVDTALLRRHLDATEDPDGARRALRRRTPTAMILHANEIAAVLGFLVSERASGLSGAAITVDGGLTTTFDFDSQSG